MNQLSKSIALTLLLATFSIALGAIALTAELWRKQSYLQTQVVLQAKELDRQLSQLSILPRLLSLDPRLVNALKSPQDITIRLANEALSLTKRESGVSFAFLMNRQGDTIASSNWQDPVSFIGQNYRFRPYFSGALEGRRSTFFAVGATTGNPGYFIADAVRVRGTIIGVIVVKMELDKLLESWSKNSFTSLLADELGVVILSTESQLLYVPSRQLNTDEQQTINDDRRYKLNPGTNLEPLSHSLLKQKVWRWNNGSNRKLYFAVDGRLQSEPWTLLNFIPLTGIITGAALYFIIMAGLLLIAALISRGYRQQQLIALTRERNAALLESKVKQRTSELQSAQTALIAQSNFAMLGRMSAAINHEINQPLASLRFNLATLRQLVDLPDSHSDMRETIIASDRTTKRIGRVVETLRSIARQGNTNFTSIDVSKLIVDVSDIIQRERPLAASALQVANELTSNSQKQTDPTLKLPVNITGNEILLHQALLNLLYNALDAVIDADEAKVVLYATQQKGFAVLGVIDNGAGINPSLVEHLFTPFQSQMSQRRGLGLGLTLARQITEDHNGSLQYQPVDTGGSHFSIHIPVDDNSHQRNQSSP